MPAGQLARDVEKMSDEAAADFAFMQLRKILPEASDPVSQFFKNVFCSKFDRMLLPKN